MTKSLFLIFNHQLTEAQEADARTSLDIRRFVELPSDLRALWCQVPAGLPRISDYLAPLKEWLVSQAGPGDYALIQGDFGGCFIMVCHAFENGVIPVYATTERASVEEHEADGSVRVTRQFRHRIFRPYER